MAPGKSKRAALLGARGELEEIDAELARRGRAERSRTRQDHSPGDRAGLLNAQTAAQCLSRTRLRYLVYSKKNHMPTRLKPEIITAAIEGFEVQKKNIDAQIAELRQMLSGGPAKSSTTPEPRTRKRKKFFAASRRKMALAQKARWAKIKGESEQPSKATAKPAKPKRRKMSAAGRKAISDATKKRWALKRAETAKSAPKKAAVKKAAVKVPVKKAAKKAAPVKKAAAKKPAAKTVPVPTQAVAQPAG